MEPSPALVPIVVTPLINIGVPGIIPCGSEVERVVKVDVPERTLKVSNDPEIPPGTCALSNTPPGTTCVSVPSRMLSA